MPSIFTRILQGELPGRFVWRDDRAAAFLTIAPLHPEPHLVEKLRMLSQGTLSRPIDIFDLFLHGTPITLLIIRLIRLKKGA